MLNTIILQGRLTRDCEVRYTGNGKAVASFTLAVDRAGKDGGADFIPCVAWEKTAKFLEQYFHKGDLCLVNGRMQSRDYEDKNGNKRTAYEVVVREVNFCGGKRNDSGVKFTEITEDDGDLPY